MKRVPGQCLALINQSVLDVELGWEALAEVMSLPVLM